MNFGMRSGALPSVMSHQFSQVPRAEIQRSSFNRSHGFKTTFNGGDLVPVFVDEALPGDTFNLRMSTFARLATPIVPFMDNLHLESFFFAVPVRLIWEHWEQFNGAQANPTDSTDYTVPVLTSTSSTGYAVGSLWDYFGLPTGIPGFNHSAFWSRAYNFIWNEWFRDENLQDSVVVDTDDGPDTVSDYVLLKRGKRHDYFTSCLPWPQKGPAVEIPLGAQAPVVFDNTWPTGTNHQMIVKENQSDWGSAGGRGNLLFLESSTSPNASLNSLAQEGGNFPVYLDLNGSHYADLSSATAATINSLRQAFQIQRLYERDARGGTRYTEVIRAHFGVTSPDFRLQRPEYLGGGHTPVTLSPIPQTSESDTTPQGNLAAMGYASGQGHGFTKSFTEHMVLIGLVSVRADLNYQQGLNRMWSRQSRFDFYWPALSHLGEQAVLNQEIYCQGSGDASADIAVFGYQERFAEYRYKPSLITGLFRSTASGTLDIWHLAEKFSSLPTLGSTFITDPTASVVDRVIAVDSQPQFLFDAYFNLTCARPMPTYSVPGLIDHF